MNQLLKTSLIVGEFGNTSSRIERASGSSMKKPTNPAKPPVPPPPVVRPPMPGTTENDSPINKPPSPTFPKPGGAGN